MTHTGHKADCVIKADVPYVTVIMAKNTAAEFRLDEFILPCRDQHCSGLCSALTPEILIQLLQYCDKNF